MLGPFHIVILLFLITSHLSYAAYPPTEAPRNRLFFWTVTNRTISPDGVARPALLVNDMFPGPRIDVNRGDYITVVVENKLSVPTAFHWHGFLMKGSPWYDGVPGQNQCPIPPGANFTYTFSTDDLVGTFWWHAHFENQYIDGLWGPMVIRDTPELDPYLDQYNQELVVMLSDWFHQPTGVLLKHYLSKASNGKEPMPNNGLINGKGFFNCTKVQPADLPCEQLHRGHERALFRFLPGLRYRLRIINTSAAASYVYSIDNHKMQVIEVDGIYVKPVTVDRLPINAGQRYSVIVEADQELRNYWMRAELGKDCLPKVSTNMEPVVKAIIRYEGAGRYEPTTQGRVPDNDVNNPSFSEACVDLDPTLLKPLNAQPIYEPVSKNVYLKISFHVDPVDGYTRGYLNNITYRADPWKTTLDQNLAGVTEFDKDMHVVVIDKPGEVVQVVLDNEDGDEHPFHLHGHIFQVVAQGTGKYQEGVTPLMTDNPVRRDTATVPTNGFVVIRFKADNPGVWALHCHIEWHVTVGLVMQFLELPDQLRKLGMPRQLRELCEAGPPEGFSADMGFIPPSPPAAKRHAQTLQQ
ncbi:hypothetical protein BGW42_000226 [Actinomortierella wolfii]|nr:hypothetical protein BGW42_000226 [Actinomortierella wolfii]